MKTREAKKWLRAMPTFREGHRYLNQLDGMRIFFVPQLCGQDVVLEGEPAEYDTSYAAIAAAARFQAAIKNNHPEISVS